MIHIISDSSTLYSKEVANKIGLKSCPLAITIAGKNYREFEELTSERMIELIDEGNLPTSSQPPIGEKMNMYNEYAKDSEVIDITMAAGLSGTYDTACMAKESCDYPENVSVFNTKTLCGPHRELVDTALDMAKNGASRQEILEMLEKSSNTEVSFLIPFDFGYLQRGGRLSKTAAGIGGVLKLVVCLVKSDDGRRLEKFSISRTLKKTISGMLDEFEKRGVDSSYELSVSHAFNKEVALKVKEAMGTRFPNCNVKLYPLSPAFITQGGPKCCAVQAIKIVK